MNHERRLSTRDGNEIALSSFGDPAAPAVVLLHGGGQTRASWRATARRLACNGYYATSFDARGHGSSSWAADGDYSLPAYAHDLAAVVESLPSPPVVVGASMGGFAALIGLGNRWFSASALVLVDVALLMDTAGSRRIKAFMEGHANGFASVEEAADAIAAHRGRPRAPNLASLQRSLRRRADGRLYWHWDPRILWESFESTGALLQPQLEQAARSLRIPTLLIRGRDSDVVTDEALHRFQTLVPQGEIAEVAGAGHMIVGDENALFNDILLAFLRRVAVIPLSIPQ